MIQVAITTAPRPQPTLGPSLTSLRQAGYLEPVVVVVDGPVCDVENQVDTRSAMVVARGGGIVRTWVRAVQMLLDMDAQWLMVMQDDVTWDPKTWPIAQEAIMQIAVHNPQLGYASLHTMPRNAAAIQSSGSVPVVAAWYETGPIQPHLHKQRWCGAQCWAMPRSAAMALLDDPEFRLFTNTNTRGFDHQVTLTLNRLGLSTYTWWPSLVSHELGKGNRAPRRRAA